MYVVVPNFSNDEKVCSSTLLKTVYTTDILIEQVHKFQKSYFKEHQWKAVPVLEKPYCLRAWTWDNLWKRTYYIEADQNTECINLFFQFPKFRLVRCFTLCFTTQVYPQGAKWKKLLIDWNENQENTTSIDFQFHPPKLNRESCFTFSRLWWSM